MVNCYSIRVNLVTSVDAYPFLIMKELLINATENNFFSQKSSHHQEPWKEQDKQFTAFEVGGEFIRICFGITNAVPAFQRSN